MGVDWHRMKPKPGTDLTKLRELARAEAVAYQSMNGWYPVHETDPVARDIQLELHRVACGAATEAIRERTDWAGWDRERECATDYPDLVPTWRVLVLSQNPIFPPLVRCQAFRTILPDELPDQLAAWRQWTEGVLHGDHDAYLRELHCYVTADWARYHWSCLHRTAVNSLSAIGGWASKPELVAVRDEILRLPEPAILRIPVMPTSLPRGLPDIDFADAYPAALATARSLVELTKRWDACVRDNKKLKYYEECYRFSLDDFRAHASEQWVQEFFAWAGQCVELGFGLCLDG
jgi:hypothetical protein